ncbi:MAG: hypothetical protein U0175_27920 [Caldilineaceae bacterium]
MWLLRVYGLVSSFKTMVESAPVLRRSFAVRMVICYQANTDVVFAAGQDGDASNLINRYEWSSDGGFLKITTNQPEISIATKAGTTPNQLGSGLHTLQFRVRDGNEGNDNVLIWTGHSR